ncbi:hypothetical protein Niako_2506 [Niastella koreensis GR20-10]|uniref:Uncharacterized protein n=1 Tax=Niastella koreensis (strain DSM 17620 / KACC 11465 / NBRC 106392 / GR20-10) TaxID=700598 RepID=G8TNE4_NIAKG|nr:hypothetical protein Niako_2506 [Niastella koreensis GR20-10]
MQLIHTIEIAPYDFADGKYEMPRPGSTAQSCS